MHNFRLNRVYLRICFFTPAKEQVITGLLPSNLLKQETVVFKPKYHVWEESNRVLQLNWASETELGYATNHSGLPSRNKLSISPNMKCMLTAEDCGLLEMEVIHVKEIFCLHNKTHEPHSLCTIEWYIVHTVSAMRVCMYVCGGCLRSDEYVYVCVFACVSHSRAHSWIRSSPTCTVDPRWNCEVNSKNTKNPLRQSNFVKIYLFKCTRKLEIKKICHFVNFFKSINITPLPERTSDLSGGVIVHLVHVQVDQSGGNLLIYTQKLVTLVKNVFSWSVHSTKRLNRCFQAEHFWEAHEFFQRIFERANGNPEGLVTAGELVRKPCLLISR